jgi:hypothetical protein
MPSRWIDYGEYVSSRSIQHSNSALVPPSQLVLPPSSKPSLARKSRFHEEILQTVAHLHSDGNTNAEHIQQDFSEMLGAEIYEAKLAKLS